MKLPWMTIDILHRKALREGRDLCSQCGGTGEIAYLDLGANDELVDTKGDCNRCFGKLLEPLPVKPVQVNHVAVLDAAVAAMQGTFGRKLV